MLRHIKSLLANKPILSFLSISASAALLLFPGSATPDDLPSIPHLDKVFHVVLFAGCAFSLYFDFIIKKKKAHLLPALKFGFILLVAGAIIEVLQESFLNRTGSMDDLIADLIGIVLGSIVAFYIAQPIYNWMKD